MIKLIKKNNKSSVRKFVIFSILAFLVLFFLLVFISLNYFQPNVDNLYNNSSTSDNLKFIDKSSDPFIVYPVLESDLKELTAPVIADNNPIYGDSEAELNIFYYSDYNCKYCWQQVDILKSLVNKYDDQVKLVWKDYPELDYNSLSFKAAIAGRCAVEQNKFWQFQQMFHDQFSIFKAEYGASLKAFDEFIYGISASLDLKEREFTDCYSNLKTKDLILQDIAEAQKLGILGVPFTYVGEREMLGEYNQEDVEFLIKNQLE